MKARAVVRFIGRVQGVFFRANTREKALELGLTGWVKNELDGSVVAVFEGEKEKIDEIIEWCKSGGIPLARVDKVEIKWEPYTGSFRTFEIKYY